MYMMPVLTPHSVLQFLQQYTELRKQFWFEDHWAADMSMREPSAWMKGQNKSVLWFIKVYVKKVEFN